MRLNLAEAVRYYEQNDPRGEYVLVVEGAQGMKDEVAFWKDMTVSQHVDFYVSSGLSKMDAIKRVAKDRGVQKNIIYKEICN